MAKVVDHSEKFNFKEARKQIVVDRLHRARDFVDTGDFESALYEFNKIMFYEKEGEAGDGYGAKVSFMRSQENLRNNRVSDSSIAPEVYAERAEIYVKMWDFSSAIAHFKKALRLKHKDDWERKLNQLYFLKGLSLIEEGYWNDALNLVKTLQSEDVKFIYLRALAYTVKPFVQSPLCLVPPHEIEKISVVDKIWYKFRLFFI